MNFMNIAFCLSGTLILKAALNFAQCLLFSSGSKCDQRKCQEYDPGVPCAPNTVFEWKH